MERFFADRRDGARQLAPLLHRALAGAHQPLILGLPRGGVPVAAELSRRLQIPYEVLVVRKIGHPGFPEYGIGALTEDEVPWLDPEAMGLERTTSEEIEAVIAEELEELRKRVQLFRGGRPLPPFLHRDIVIADDGLATGVTATVATRFAKARGARQLILAVPVASTSGAAALRGQGAQIVTALETENFRAVGEFYLRFGQTSEAEVLTELANRDALGIASGGGQPGAHP